ncbi:MAG TPA: VOC family protein [Polyangiaceae bacterium]|nr:VOC family protein [Polyangiaceae bacterium]
MKSEFVEKSDILRAQPMTTSVSVSIDVPNLAAGIAFYCAAFGFSKKSEPVPGVAVLQGLGLELCLLEKPAGSQPSPRTKDRRNYERHWSPVHLDFHVDDLQAALQRVEALGAKREQVFENPEHGSAAFCSDPFGHGFCLLAQNA